MGHRMIEVLTACGDKCGDEYMLRQTAEECMELAWAILKAIRAENGETPMTIEEARARVIEELADVSVMTFWLKLVMLRDEDMNTLSLTMERKVQRMYDRLLGGGMYEGQKREDGHEGRDAGEVPGVSGADRSSEGV